VNVPNSAANRPPVAASPAQACDAHIHIYETGFPSQGYLPSHADVEAYRKLRALLGTTRAVVVQPRVYGTDNSVTLRAIQALGPAHARGIAVVYQDVDESTLAHLHEGGIRGVRLSLHEPNATAGGFNAVERLAHKVGPLGWHLQLHWTADQIADQQSLLRRLPVPVVFDHLARFPLARPLSHPAFPVVQSLLEAERAWVKLSGPYLDSAVGGDGAYHDTDTIARAWLAIAPHRAVWGSDWPHVTERVQKPDDAQLFDVLARWCDDEATRLRVLVENPAKLYGFNTP